MFFLNDAIQYLIETHHNEVRGMRQKGTSAKGIMGHIIADGTTAEVLQGAMNQLKIPPTTQQVVLYYYRKEMIRRTLNAAYNECNKWLKLRQFKKLIEPAVALGMTQQDLTEWAENKRKTNKKEWVEEFVCATKGSARAE